MVFGIIFVIVGLLGFVPNPIVGMDSLFHTDSLHNIVHLVIGLILLYTGTKAGGSAPMALKVIGIIYLLLAILGWIGSGESILGLVEINGADNWLHLVLGVVLVWAGFAGKKSSDMGGMSPQPMA